MKKSNFLDPKSLGFGSGGPSSGMKRGSVRPSIRGSVTLNPRKSALLLNAEKISPNTKNRRSTSS